MNGHTIKHKYSLFHGVAETNLRRDALEECFRQLAAKLAHQTQLKGVFSIEEAPLDSKASGRYEQREVTVELVLDEVSEPEADEPATDEEPAYE